MATFLLPPSRSHRGGGMPLQHYSGTLYQQFDAGALTVEQLGWAHRHLLIHSAEHGLVPMYSWDPVAPLTEAWTATGTVIDLRSGEFVRKAKLPAGGWSVKVVSEGDDGRRIAVSHWNKLHKGRLVGALLDEMPSILTIDEFLAWADGACFRFERVGEHQLEFVV